MKKKQNLNFSNQKQQLEDIIQQLNEDAPFEQKQQLYSQGLEIINTLEAYLKQQQDVFTEIIYNENDT